jgi:hypothetical protein
MSAIFEEEERNGSFVLDLITSVVIRIELQNITLPKLIFSWEEENIN